MSRDNDELIKKVFLAQKEQPTRGDFVKLVEKDLSDLGLSCEDITSGKIDKKKLKHLLNVKHLRTFYCHKKNIQKSIKLNMKSSHFNLI